MLHACVQRPIVESQQGKPSTILSIRKYSNVIISCPDHVYPLTITCCLIWDTYHTPLAKKVGYSCGILFVDHASGKIFNFCQFSNNPSETINSKWHLESLARQEGITVKKYHADNGVFASNKFKSECRESLHQGYSFSGVGAHHQNGVAERNIKTVSQWARANMLHFAHHWPSQVNVKFWPQAIEYSLWVFNRMPSMHNGLPPNEIWSSCHAPTKEFHQAHVFGCPLYILVLDATLQDGHKIPKWSPRARLGVFLGFSTLHSLQVPLVMNTTTEQILPQYHVIFDDKFETILSMNENDPISAQWESIFRLRQECYEDIDYDIDGHPIMPPLLSLLEGTESLPAEDYNVPTTVPTDRPNIDINSLEIETNTDTEGLPTRAPTNETGSTSTFPDGVPASEGATIQPTDLRNSINPIDTFKNSN